MVSSQTAHCKGQDCAGDGYSLPQHFPFHHVQCAKRLDDTRRNQIFPRVHCGRDSPLADGGKDSPGPGHLPGGNAPHLGHGFNQQNGGKRTAVRCNDNLCGCTDTGLTADDFVHEEKWGAVGKILGGI